MERCVILLSIPGLRHQDLPVMPRLTETLRHEVPLTPSFPCVTWPVQANMLTGRLPREHGVVANGFYWRESRQVEMWTAENQRIESPQIWDRLHEHHPDCLSAAWFPMLSKGCGADYVCMPAPVHNPDGSESLWCYTKPRAFYGELRDALGHFPLQHFWGPWANIQSTSWIVDSAVHTARRFHPHFFYVYLPHLDYAAQRQGPNSPAALTALVELDTVIGRLIDGLTDAYGIRELVWLAASEYVITDVHHVSYPNRVLRQEGHLQVRADARSGTTGFRSKRGVGHGRPPVLSRVRARPGCPLDQRHCSAVYRRAGDRGSAGRPTARQVRAGPSAGWRGRVDLRVVELAGLLLVARRCTCTGVCPDRRYSPQAGLRPGGTAL